MEQVKAEPVADWLQECTDGRVSSHTITMLNSFRRWYDEYRPLYATPQPAAVDGLVDNKAVQRAVMASVSLGAWMSAALDDPAVCDAMKADIQEWFSAGEPVQMMAQALAQNERNEDGNG
ncbi:MAG: hypothetical protein IPO08_19735 [Xanthomonadales bacterium]|nr:hypothetical protein [Xanthomonadales bacterium]